jgi:hypothetical protein
MSLTILRITAAAAAIVLVPMAALAQATSGKADTGEVFALNDNDGIFVDKGSFKVVRANGAKGDPAATLAKMGAKEVSASAVIYRLGDKLYIVDGTPPANATTQFMTTLQDWCATCHWYTPGSYMK